MKYRDPETPSGLTNRLGRLFPEWVALVVATLVMSGEFTPLQGYDWLRMHVWHKLAYQEALLGGGWSEWNPYVGMGRPTFAEIEAAIFYPPNLVFILGPTIGLALGIWGHLVVAIRGMLALMKSQGIGPHGAWFAAVAWTLGAPLMGRLQSGQIQVVFALVWLPLILVLAREVVIGKRWRSRLQLALAAAMVVLAGSPPMAWIIAWTSLIWVIGLRWLPAQNVSVIRAMGGLATAGFIALGLAAIQVWPFLELLGQGNRGADGVAFAVNNSMSGQSWGSLLFSRSGQRFFYWEYNLYGGVLLAVFAVVGLVQVRAKRAVWLWMFMAIGFALLALGGATPLLPTLAEWLPGWDALRYSSRYAIVTFFAVAVLAAYGVDALSKNQKLPVDWKSKLGVILIAINALSLLSAYRERQPAYAEHSDFAREQRLAEILPKISTGQPPPRVLVPGWEVRANAGMAMKFSSVTGFGNPALRSVWDALHTASGVAHDSQDPVNLPAEVFVAPRGAFSSLALDLRWDMQTLSFVEPEQSFARFSFSGGEIANLNYAADQIDLTLAPNTGGTLRIAEPWYPGWVATIDGETAVAVDRFEGWMRAMEVPPGASEVTLTYHQNGLRGGAVISLGSLIFCAGLWWRSRAE